MANKLKNNKRGVIVPLSWIMGIEMRVEAVEKAKGVNEINENVSALVGYASSAGAVLKHAKRVNYE